MSIAHCIYQPTTKIMLFVDPVGARGGDARR